MKKRKDVTEQLNLFSPDWGIASVPFDVILESIKGKDLSAFSEAQTRFDVIDRVIKEVLGWEYGQVTVEERQSPSKPKSRSKDGYIDYVLRSGDYTIVIEAKKTGSAFPSPTKRVKLKLNGSVLGKGEILNARLQAEEYARSQNAQFVVVTNGLCWCYYPLKNSEGQEDYGYLLFPFQDHKHAEKLFRHFSKNAVEQGSLLDIDTSFSDDVENRLLNQVQDSDSRVDRNNVADFIAPALNNALYAEAIINDPVNLEKCFVATEARTKFDNQLGIYLADPKPHTVKPADRIRTDKQKGKLQDLVEQAHTPDYAPPVTLVLGPVGAGKSTYLKHFELVAGRRVIQDQKARWIYVDFEAMGKAGNPRSFIYEKLKEYLQSESSQINYKNVIEPAYEEVIASLARGHLEALYKRNKQEFDKRIIDKIDKEFNDTEPYVNRIMRFLAQHNLCVVVLDNIDLYEDEDLETQVFSEGLALSKTIFSHVIVSLRDRTFIKHRNSSVFDAYEFKKLWLDPPPLKSIIKKRLTYAKKILEGRSAKIPLPGNKSLVVDDLSEFFDIVQSSVLEDSAGGFIDNVCDTNIRKGITLLTQFLTSGHIQADRAIKNYIRDDKTWRFPFHEVFKGAMLGQWKYYKEERSNYCINLFDSRLPAKKLRLLRLHVLKHLVFNASSKSSVEVPIMESIQLFTKLGASSEQILKIHNELYKLGLIRSVTAEEIDESSVVAITRSGAYFVNALCKRFVYAESCMFDTAIEDKAVWSSLVDITKKVEAESGSLYSKMKMRNKRIKVFLSYLRAIEFSFLGEQSENSFLHSLEDIEAEVIADSDDAVQRTGFREGAVTRTPSKRKRIRK